MSEERATFILNSSSHVYSHTSIFGLSPLIPIFIVPHPIVSYVSEEVLSLSTKSLSHRYNQSAGTSLATTTDQFESINLSPTLQNKVCVGCLHLQCIYDFIVHMQSCVKMDFMLFTNLRSDIDQFPLLPFHSPPRIASQ